MRRDECSLEQMAARQRVGAAVFLPFAIVRLRGEGRDATETTLTITLRDIERVGIEVQRSVRLSWDTITAPDGPMAVQEHTVTEWAACGVACALLSLYTGLQVRAVAAEGDRFDYWVGNEEREVGLEVSGTQL